ncbi:hypothetical protein AJ79_00864 [Helicocarpus griseus UAMH5409]|uniref:Non-homologous end-joining factor 1 n=1 Tax=Helicocarpus griseus UAMH5409 TaxID=1447875 RepID=A0A2B7Y9N8_9EURO|nr:hypothetical protein AJ79_00864 [Helicocarpus griseus UAMH5409]
MSKWSKLPLLDDTTPPLLYQYTTSKSGCELYVTDLAYVWSQILTRKKILDNASAYGTSIDPSEDEEQYFVLLQKIADALQGSKGCSLSLSRDAGSEDLKLATLTKLPPPLDPLEWTFTLSQQPQNALTRQILLPILKGEANHEARIMSLIDHVKQKDWALSKLFDKIESSGVDLSTVFPGMGGVRLSKKESVYSQASKHIKGVAPFDEESWNSEYEAKNANYNLGVHIAKELSGSSSLLDLAADDFAPEAWWEKLSTVTKAPKTAAKSNKPQEKKPAKRKSPSPMEEDNSPESDDDEFQTMETPPRLRSPSRKQAEARKLNDSTSPTRKRQAESVEGSTEGSPAPPSPKAKDKGKRVGAIGGGRKKKPSPEPQPSSGEATEDEDEDIRPPPTHRAKAQGLGTIGGKQKAKPKPSPSPSPTQSEAESEPPAKKPEPMSKSKGGLGTVGVKKEKEKPEKPPRQETPEESTASDVSDSPKSKSKPKSKPTKRPVSPDDMPTASENDTEASSTSQPSTSKRKRPEPASSPPPKSQKQQPKSRNLGGIGQIGGKKKKPAPEPEPEPEPEQPDTAKAAKPSDDEDNETDTSPKPKPKRPGGKLGVIGGRNKPAPPPRKERSPSSASTDGGGDYENKAAGRRGMSESAPPPTSTDGKTATSGPEKGKREEEAKQEEKEETPEERANRKRLELRKQLEARNKGTGTAAGRPAKKRRRF